MIGRAISIIAENIWFYVIIAVFVTAAFAAQDYGLIKHGVNSGFSIIMMLVLLYVQRAVLFGGKFADRQADGTPYKPPVFRYSLKAFALFLIPILAVVIVVAILAPETIHSSHSMSGGLLLYYFILSMLIAGLSFAVAGTWLPATIHGTRPGFVDALRRAPSTFLSSCSWFLLVGFIEVAKFIVVGVLMNYGMKLDIFTDKIFSPQGFLLTFALQLLEMALVTLVAVVLAHNYMRFEGLSPATPDQA